MRRSRRIVGKPRRPKVERTSEAKWPQGAAPRSPVLRHQVRPSVSFSAALRSESAALRLESAALGSRFAAEPAFLPRPCRDLPRCRSDLPRSLLSNDPTADASPRFSNRDPPRPPDQPTHRPTNLAPRSTTTFRGVSRSPISAVVDDDVPRSVAVGFCSAAKCRDAWFRAPRFRVVFIPVAPRSAAPPHPRFAWARTVYPRFA